MKTQAQFLGEALQTELLWEPGTKYRYSNIGYGLLGVIIERLSGQSYDRFLENQFFNPLGMKATGTHLPEWNAERVAVGYRGGKRWGTALEREMASDGPSWNLRAAGGMLSTVEDLHRWSQALQSCQVLKKSSVDRLFSPHIPEDAAGTYHYGYGWSISRRGSGTTRVSHNGSNGIFYADLHQYIEDGLILIFLTNSYDDTTELIISNLSRLIFGEGSIPFPPAIEQPTPVPGLEGLAGTYFHPEIGLVDVTVKADLLVMEPYGQQALEVFAANEPEKVDYYRLLNNRSKAIVAGFNRGDYRALEKYTEAARFQRLGSFLKGYWKPEWGNEKDARKCQVLGTMAEVWRDAGRVASFVRTGEGKPFFQILWKGEEVVGFLMGSAIHPARTRFIPVEGLDFLGFHPGAGKTTSIRFKTGEDGEGKQFWIGDLPAPWTKTAV